MSSVQPADVSHYEVGISTISDTYITEAINTYHETHLRRAQRYMLCVCMHMQVSTCGHIRRDHVEHHQNDSSTCMHCAHALHPYTNPNSNPSRYMLQWSEQNIIMDTIACDHHGKR